LTHWHFWIDRGGTFTDCIGRSPQGALTVIKVLSSDHAPLAGIRRILGLESQAPIPKCRIHLGTTIATNALLERKGSPFGLAITTGFKDLLEIGTQQRPDLFELTIQKPTTLYNTVVEIDERVSANGDVIIPLNTQKVEQALKKILSKGIQNLAIVFLHGYRYPQHEQQVAKIATQLGFKYITCSSAICPEIGFSSRGDTTTAECYLTPRLSVYLQRLHRELGDSHLLMMKSSGGVTSSQTINGHEAILSGPAGGVSALSAIATDLNISQLIGFDMGGTSTDVSRYNGDFERTYETTIGGVRIKTPMLAIHTIASGGGSICRWQAGRFTVGPDSAGAEPGPLCYDLKDAKGQPKAQELTVTDCHVYLGRIQPNRFPLRIQKKPILNALKAIQKRGQEKGHYLSFDEISEGFLSIANAKMAEAIKTVSISKGEDVREYQLCCFGGAGALHACAIARLLAIKTIVIHPLSGVFSAYGIGLALNTWEGSHPVQNQPLTPETMTTIQQDINRLIQSGTTHLRDQESQLNTITHTTFLDLRFVGTDVSLTISQTEDNHEDNPEAYEAAFHQEYKATYGHTFSDRPIEITQCRIQISAHPMHRLTHTNYQPLSKKAATPMTQTPVTFQGQVHSTPLYLRQELSLNNTFQGPAIILEDTSTIVIEPGFEATVHSRGCLLI
jgi:5-oxoprolinase (ATP-hydrolysing)